MHLTTYNSPEGKVIILWQVLLAHLDITDAAVLGVEDPTWGQKVAGPVQRKCPQLSNQKSQWLWCRWLLCWCWDLAAPRWGWRRWKSGSVTSYPATKRPGKSGKDHPSHCMCFTWPFQDSICDAKKCHGKSEQEGTSENSIWRPNIKMNVQRHAIAINIYFVYVQSALFSSVKTITL